MTKNILLGVICFILLGVLAIADGYHRNGNCPWLVYKRSSTCLRSNFLCFDGKCIDRKLYCNGRYGCGDNSDESYCREYNCPENKEMKRCREHKKCIPEHWFCDGIVDCPGGVDELACGGVNLTRSNREIAATANAVRWLYNQRKEIAGEMWGNFVEKTAVSLYFVNWNSTFTANDSKTRKEIAYEVSLQLLSRLIKGKKLQEIPSTDLASFVNAFLVSCLDPRKFYGMNIIEELRNRVNGQNYTNPYVLLSLCNAGDSITDSDKVKLVDVFWNRRRTFWTDVQAFVVMALACASRQPGNDAILEQMSELTMELKLQQSRNGSIGNLQTTALVMQALLSAEPKNDPDNFDEAKALEQILSSQKEDGSFGNLMNTYFVLPVLTCQSLVNISSDHCQQIRRDEISALESLANRIGPKMRVHYSLWIGDDKDLERNVALLVPTGISFYEVMEIAAEIDTQYSFEYVVKNRKPYVNAISGLQDNPERGRYWFLYKVGNGVPTLAPESPAEVKPKNNDHFVMWYRSGTWIDGLNNLPVKEVEKI